MTSPTCSKLFAAAVLTTLCACGRGEQDVVTLNAPSVRFVSGKLHVTRATLRERVSIHAEGITPGLPVTLHLEMTDGSRSQATFVADADGRIDTAVQAPTHGDYAGVDADGLFWSMKAEQPSLLTEGPLHVTVTAEVDGVATAAARLERFESIGGMVAGLDYDEENPCGTPIPRPPGITGGGQTAE